MYELLMQSGFQTAGELGCANKSHGTSQVVMRALCEDIVICFSYM
jgi:hypothetical protein